MPQLKVELVQRPVSMEIAVKVSLSSETRAGLWSQGYIDPDVEHFEREVSSLAGRLAEHQCEMYKDRHNPDQIALTAHNMARKLKAKGEKQLKKGLETNVG